MRLLTYQMPDELLAVASAGEFDEYPLMRQTHHRRYCAAVVIHSDAAKP
jgi:hypothetical protein